ncbi:MAG: hypothetical protein LKJ05_06515 [Bifidobacteriaceae bacterium]|nr:hypothetical protein [Bifidobacteriaceae bacterium]MCI1936237.1 hypothetical protein [Bifidobacteriaceae bacterium]
MGPARADTIDPTVLSSTQSNAAVVANDSSKKTDTITVAYTAAAQDKLTITLPDGFVGTLSTDAAPSGATLYFAAADGSTTSVDSTTSPVKTITLSFAASSRVTAFRVNLTPCMPLTMTNVSKVGNSDFMQKGTFTVGVSAMKSGTKYSADATFTTDPGVSSDATWTTLRQGKIAGRTFVRNAPYTFSLGNIAADSEFTYGSVPQAQQVGVCLATAKQVQFYLPGGFTLDTASSSPGFSQPLGVDGPVIWTNPDSGNSLKATGCTYNAARVGFTGTFTKAAGTYTNADPSNTFYEGFSSYSTTTTKSYLQAPWNLKIQNYSAPTVTASNDNTALVGTSANLAAHPAEVAWVGQLRLYNAVTEDENDVTYSVPMVDGSALLGTELTVRSMVGEKVTLTYQKKSMSSAQSVTTTFTESDVKVTYVAGKPYNFVVSLPMTTADDPIVSLKVSVTKLSQETNSSNDVLNQKLYYQALTKKTDGTAITNGLRANGALEVKGTGDATGTTWSQQGTLVVTYYDTLGVTGDATCGQIASETTAGASGCALAFGEANTVGLGKVFFNQTGGTYPFYYGFIDQPVIYYLLPAHATVTGYKFDPSASSGVLNQVSSTYTQQQPTLYQSRVGNQILVKLDWTGKGWVSRDVLNQTKVKFTLPGAMVNKDSTVATWMTAHLTSDDVMSFAPRQNAVRVDVSDATAAVKKMSPNAVLMGSMKARITGPESMSGDATISDNLGATSTSAKNNLNDGTAHNIEISALNNTSDVVPGVRGLINLTSASDGLTLNLTGPGTVTDDNGDTVADTTSSPAYLLYSTSTQTPASATARVQTDGYVRASAVTDWSSIRSVILSIPSQAATTWYFANLPVNAPSAADELFHQVSMPYYLGNEQARYDPGVTVKDMFYGFSGTVIWNDEEDIDA